VKSFATADLDQEMQAFLRAEVSIHAALDHPHILRVEHVCESDDLLQIVTEHMAGGDLHAQLLRRKPCFSEAAAADAYTKNKNDYEVLKASKEAERKGAETEIASLSNSIRDLGNDVKSTSAELDAVLDYLEKLKDACTHKVMSFEERAAKMQQEIDSLEQALEIGDSCDDHGLKAQAYGGLRCHTKAPSLTQPTVVDDTVTKPNSTMFKAATAAPPTEEESAWCLYGPEEETRDDPLCNL